MPKMEAANRDGMLFAMGNPLLDISAVVDNIILEKYGLKPNDAILAEEKHIPLYKELVEKYKVKYIAGGSAQNSLRVAQWFLQRPNTTAYIGCVGDDENSKILAEKAREDGVDVMYQYTDKKPTGTCAVLVTKNGSNRSLCANLAAAECFTKDHLDKPNVKNVMSHAEYYYSSGFFLTVSIATILEVAQLAHKRNKIFMLNLSAPFLPVYFKNQMMQVMPYVDILFGNETEALAFAKEHNYETEEISEIALKMTRLPKQNEERHRIVIITQGTLPVIMAKDDKISKFPVSKVLQEEIVDTNGAGDAFVGGFMSQLVKGETYENGIKCGIWAASEIVKRSGCTFEGKPSFSLQ